MDLFDEYIPERAIFYIILNGNFKVSSLRFNKRKKKNAGEYNPSADLLIGSKAEDRS